MSLYDKYSARGLEILAFPCNQFGAQEPGTAAQIKGFAKGYGVKFPVMAKVDVNGANAHPLWAWMKQETSSFGISGLDNIKWNFGKFLLDKEGKVSKRFAPTSSPLSIVGDIEKLL